MNSGSSILHEGFCKAISDATPATQPISSSLKRTGMISRSAIVLLALF
jgi:hypothetical protein